MHNIFVLVVWLYFLTVVPGVFKVAVDYIYVELTSYLYVHANTITADEASG